MVEDVEEVPFQLDPLAFSHTERLLQREVEIRVTGSMECIAAHVADIACCRVGEEYRVAGRPRFHAGAGEEVERIFEVQPYRGAVRDGPVSKLVEPAEVSHRAGNDRERIAGMPVGDAGNVPSAQQVLHHSIGGPQYRSSLAEGRFIQVRRSCLMADVKGRWTVLGSGIAGVSIEAGLARAAKESRVIVQCLAVGV